MCRLPSVRFAEADLTHCRLAYLDQIEIGYSLPRVNGARILSECHVEQPLDALDP
jgi:hypothetical protein